MLVKGKVLVSGGAGFIGREVVKQLLYKGYQVTVLDKAEPPSDFNNVKYIKGDIQNAAKCVMATAGQDFVIHLAARPRIPQSFIDPDSYYDDNVTGTRNMLTAASAVGIRKFIYASSSSIYGNNPVPHRPFHKPDPLNYYAMTKLFGEHLCKQYKNMFNLNYNILRFFTVYGDEQPSDDNKGLMIAKFYRLAEEGKPLTVHGDGSFRRDYIHVSDVAKACVASMESKVKSEIFNVGTGENVSVNDVITILREFFPDLRVELEPKPKGYAPETLADISKAKKLLGWKPEIIVEDGIRNLYKKKNT